MMKIVKQTTLVLLFGLSAIFMGCLETGYGDWGYSGGFSSSYTSYPIATNSDTTSTENSNERVTKDNSYYGESSQPYIRSRESRNNFEK